MLWIVRDTAIYYFSHAQSKAYLPSAPNIVSLKVQFECDTLKHKHWEINQVTVHCTLVTESCSVDIAYIFKRNRNVRYIISYYYGWKCKINHPRAVHDVNLHVAGTCLFFCYQNVIAHAWLIHEPSFIHCTSSFNSSTGSSKCTTTRNFSCRSQSHSSLGMYSWERS